MKLLRDRLVYLALSVLEDTITAAGRSPVEPSMQLRLALAVVHALSEGPLGIQPDYQSVLDEFWRVVTGQGSESNTQAGYRRSTFARTCMHQIERQVRPSEAVSRALTTRSSRRAIEAARQFVHDDDETKLDKRRYYWRPPPKS